MRFNKALFAFQLYTFDYSFEMPLAVFLLFVCFLLMLILNTHSLNIIPQYPKYLTWKNDNHFINKPTPHFYLADLFCTKIKYIQ